MGNIDAICESIYAEMAQFYGLRVSATCPYGFKILYGPPLFRPSILFLGYQPGGGIEDYERELADGAQRRWPQINEYADETRKWALARNMRAMFGKSFLESSVGLNALFVRSPSVERYQSDIDAATRLAIQKFCFPRVERIIDAVEPQRIILIGLGTLALFGRGETDLVSEKGHVLTRLGEISGRRVLAVQHLSAAHISNPNRNRIRDRILAF